jgi:hypothetical protein
LPQTGIEPRLLGRPDRSLVAILTELSRLLILNLIVNLVTWQKLEPVLTGSFMTPKFVFMWERLRMECVAVDYAELVYISYTFTACGLQSLPPAALLLITRKLTTVASIVAK